MTDKPTPREFTISAVDLRVSLTTALAFAGTDDIHPLLNGVQFKAADGAVELMATDRYVASCENVKVAGEPFSFVIPGDVARRLLTVVPKGTRRNPLTGMVSFIEAGEQVTAKFVGEIDLSMTFNPLVDFSKFPDFRKLLDNSTTEQPEAITSIAFNPLLIARVFRALSSRDRDLVRMSFTTALKPLIVRHGESFSALVMPARLRETEDRAA